MGMQLDLNNQTKEEEAISFLKDNEPEEGYFLGFSGGKDSIVMENLAKLSGVKYKLYHSLTGIDAPQTVQFIKRNYPQTTLCRPKENFYKLLVKKGFPMRFSRWCCNSIRKAPTMNIPLRHRLMGQRREESYMRARRPRIENYPSNAKNPKHIIYKPIYYFLEWEIWDHIERYGLKYPSLYDEGFHRIGCIVCPFFCNKNQTELNLHKNKFKGQYRAFERAMYALYEDHEWYRQKAQGRAQLFEEFLDNWYKGK